jgi:hypothetical protein
MDIEIVNMMNSTEKLVNLAYIQNESQIIS